MEIFFDFGNVPPTLSRDPPSSSRNSIESSQNSMKKGGKWHGTILHVPCLESKFLTKELPFHFKGKKGANFTCVSLISDLPALICYVKRPYHSQIQEVDLPIVISSSTTGRKANKRASRAEQTLRKRSTIHVVEYEFYLVRVTY